MIEAISLTKQYDKLTALYGISFKLRRGGALGILGQAGAGKSTLMNILAGCLTPTSGSVIIDGMPLKRGRGGGAGVGYMPGNDPLYADMTVREYLDFCFSLKRIPVDDRAAEQERLFSLTAFDAEDSLLTADLDVLQRRKLSLCQALAGDPELILLDDPARPLGTAQAEELNSIIREAAADKTMIYASRSLTECTELCDSVIMINRGRVAVNSSLASLSAEISECTRLKLKVVASRAAARSLLSGIPEITDVELQPAQEKGAVDLVVTYPAQHDLRRTLWEHTQTAGVPVLEMKQLNISLEDLYLQMSGER